MKTFHAVLSTVTGFLWWAGLFAACRVAVWAAGRPAWWTVPAALGVGMAWIGAKAAFGGANRLHGAGGIGDAADPALRLRMAAAWKRGAGFLSGGIFSPPPPLYLFLDATRNGTAPVLELGDAGDADTAGFGDEFVWYRGPDAVWVEYPSAHVRNDGGRWGAFAEASAGARFAGVVVSLDAARLAANDMADAAALGSRLESLQESRKSGLPVYLVLDNIDRLYGVRSLASRLGLERLGMPLGDVRDRAGEKSSAFFRRVLSQGIALLEEAGGGARLNANAEPQSPSSPPPSSLSPPDAAALLAPVELARLEMPLTRFCRQVFPAGRGERAPWIRGLYFAASAPGGSDSLPAVLARLASFEPAHEPFPVQPWFLRSLFREVIPADAEAARGASASTFFSGGGAAMLRRAAGCLFSGHAAAAFVAGLAACCLVSWAFLENRSVLLSAQGRAGAPLDAAGLEEYRELAAAVRGKADGLALPRLGMTGAEDLAGELQKRYIGSYFNLKIIPGIERVQDAALEAVETGDPVRIGNALLLLAVTRESIDLALNAGGTGGADASGRAAALDSLVPVAESLRLATREDMRQLSTYFAWAGRQDWMPGTVRKLAEFERYVIDNAAGTGGAAGRDVRWLSRWVASLRGLRGVDTSRVWSVPLADDSLARVDSAWTREGYAVAKSLLDALAYDEQNPGPWRARREALLAAYRAEALERWRVAGAALWNKFRRRVPDGEVRTLLAEAAAGDDPASRFAALVRHHLLPMYQDGGAGADAAWLFARERLGIVSFDADKGDNESGNADGGRGGFVNRFVGAVREWGSDESLDRLSRGLGFSDTAADAPDAEAMTSAGKWREALRRFGVAAASPEENFAMVRSHFRASRSGEEVSSFDPLAQAGREAAVLHRYLRESAGSGAWDGLSPLAVYDYMRYLATRQAALHLDALWRERVYEPAHLAPGDDADRLERLASSGGALESFLTGVASGLWEWDGEGLANAEWDRLAFMFAPAFLDFCRTALRGERPARPEQLELPFEVLAVDVDAGAAELPVRVEFVVRTGGGEQAVEFSNYRIEEKFVWRMDAGALAEMRVAFPSVTAAVDFGGPGGFRNFVAAFSLGEARFAAGDFGGEAGESLRRMGVSEIVVKARVGNADRVEEFLRGSAFGLPESVITSGRTGI